jgi:hypothetical protein
VHSKKTIFKVARLREEHGRFSAGFDAVGYTGLANTASPPAVATGGRH